jgi:hypothetical protein
MVFTWECNPDDSCAGIASAEVDFALPRTSANDHLGKRDKTTASYVKEQTLLQ